MYCTLRSRLFEGDTLLGGLCGEGDGASDPAVIWSADELISIFFYCFRVNVQCVVFSERMNIQRFLVIC
jgi:hypothetical protein